MSQARIPHSLEPVVDTRAPRIAHAAVALPENSYTQAELSARLARRWADRPKALGALRKLHGAMAVDRRCLALPMDDYDDLKDFGAANDAFIRVGTELGARAVRDALAGAGLEPTDVDALFFTTVTGLAVPTIDARLANVLHLRSNVRRTPMFGLGCVGGAAGIARASDYLRGHPDHVAVLLSVELCSLTLQEDLSVPNLIASGLFGDGSAAVVLVGAEHKASPHRVAPLNAGTRRRGPVVIDSASALFPDTERVMGWDVGGSGFKIVLSADVPKIVHEHLPAEVDGFLAAHGLRRTDIQHWICHPGGPKVITAMEQALALPENALALTRASLQSIGNLSSASVLHVLSQTMESARPGDKGLLMAMGPGFCAELVLLSWQ